MEVLKKLKTIENPIRDYQFLNSIIFELETHQEMKYISKKLIKQYVIEQRENNEPMPDIEEYLTYEYKTKEYEKIHVIGNKIKEEHKRVRYLEAKKKYRFKNENGVKEVCQT